MKENEWVLVVGGFGFLGQYIVWGLVRRGYHVAIGTSRNKSITIQQRFDQFLHFNQLANPVFRLTPNDFHRIKIIECDISKESLDLSHSDYLWLTDNRILQIWNCAAYMKYDADAFQRCYEVNVHGTSNLLKFASTRYDCTYYHVSTAYIGGKDYCKSELLKEQHCISGTGYFNSYDETKAYAEKEVILHFNDQSKRTYAIFRPTILIGDSVTGFTSSATGLYEYLQALNRLRNQVSGKVVRVVSNQDSLLHLIPVDRCAQAMLALMPLVSHKNTPIYTIADASPITLGTMAGYLSKIFSCDVVCVLSSPEDEQSYERLLRLFTKRNQIFSQSSFRFCAEQTYSLIEKSICSDWSKTQDFFYLINQGFNAFMER